MPPNTGPPSWPQTHPAPLPSASTRKPWIVIGISVAVVVALVVGLLVWRGTSGSYGSGTSEPSSVDEVGLDRTVGLLREKDPVCDDWRKYADELSEREKPWASIDDAKPAIEWSADERRTFSEVGDAMRVAADNFESLLPRAEDVGVQELIAQTIVYLRLYIDRIPNYTAPDSLIAGAAGNFGTAVSYMCNTVPLISVDSQDGPTSRNSSPTSLRSFTEGGSSACEDFLSLLDRQEATLSGWLRADSRTSADQWGPEQRSLNLAVQTVLDRDARELRSIAEGESNHLFHDLLTIQSEYMRAFAGSIPTYIPDDLQIWKVVTAVGGGISAACKAEL